MERFTICTYIVSFVTYLMVGFSPAPVEAVHYDVSAELLIPSIGLSSDVTALGIKDGRLNTPDLIVGSFSQNENKTFLVGHSSTVFENLPEVKIGDEIIYQGETFVVNAAEVMQKADISMNDLLAKADVETLVLMTCAGEDLPGGDATHRLIITASVQ